MKAPISASESQPGTPQEGFGRRLHGWELATVMTGLLLSFFLAALDQTTSLL